MEPILLDSQVGSGCRSIGKKREYIQSPRERSGEANPLEAIPGILVSHAVCDWRGQDFPGQHSALSKADA